MKRTLIILSLVALFASCSKSKHETIDINDVVFDTLRVNVIIIGGDTLSGTVMYEDLK